MHDSLVSIHEDLIRSIFEKLNSGAGYSESLTNTLLTYRNYGQSSEKHNLISTEKEIKYFVLIYFYFIAFNAIVVYRYVK